MKKKFVVISRKEAKDLHWATSIALQDRTGYLAGLEEEPRGDSVKIGSVSEIRRCKLEIKRLNELLNVLRVKLG